MRKDMFEKLQSLSLKFFDSHTHGELMSRLSNDIETVSMTLSNTVTQLVGSLLTLAWVLIMMFVINWQMALVSLFIIPVTTAVTILIASKTRVFFRQQQKLLGQPKAVSSKKP